jgi:signal transduction histidine kinase
MLPVQLLETSLEELLEAVSRRVELVPGARGRVSFAAADQRVRVDPVWFRQAIGNLIDNAVRHTPPGGQVTVCADRRDGTVRITVEDAGPGFPQALLGSHDGAEAQRGSAGLGLAVVQTIAEAHGGRAWAENLPGGGARVTMTTSDGVPSITGT